MGGHTKNFLIAVTLLLYVTGTLARGVGEVAENTEPEQVEAFEFTTLPYDSSIALEEEGVEDLEEERRKEEEEIRKKGEGCEYDGRWYETDEVVKTHEPCLRCKCLGATLVCQLRVCPQVPDIVPQGCYRLKKAGECCEEIVCEGELENNRLYRKDTQLEGVSDGPEAELETVHIKDPAAIASVFGTRRRGAQQNVTKPWLKGCVTEGAIFAEGSAMVSPDECSYCFCIRGKQRCVAPKCLLPVEGCRPRYRSFSCCPSYYDCYDATTNTTTTTTTTESTLRDCEFNGQRYSEGSRVSVTGDRCEHCYCIGGQVNCTTYCDDTNDKTSADEFPKGFPAHESKGDLDDQTSGGSRRSAFKGHINMARMSRGEDAIITDLTEAKISRSGHAGAAFLVPGIYELSSPNPNRNPNINKAVEVGTGVNVKGNLDNAVAFGPILISDNKVRVDRQNREFNATEETETTAVDSTVATEFPEETTFITADEINITNDASTNDESSIDYETGTEEITTVFPTLSLGRDTTIKSLSELLSQATTEPTSTTTGVPSSTPESVDYIVAGDLEDTETNFPSYDITVGTSVLARPLATGVGEVIPVDIEPEHKSPEIESGPVIQEKNPTLLTALLNILTRTEPPRPETISPQSGPERLPPPPPPPGRLPPTPTGRLPPPPPGRLPPPSGRLPPPPPPPSSSFIASSFRPRPRPNSRPSRPDFIPPRFRPPPPPKATERDTTEEPETSTDPSSASPIIFVPTASEADFIAPTTESTGVVNKPVSGFGRPDHIANIPIHIVNNEDEIPIPDLPNRHVVEINSDINSRNNLPTIPDYFHNQPLATPPRVNSPTSPERLPSKPVIEGGFQAIKDEGIEPNFDNDYEYDEYGSPILPPSLPNLQIIQFEASDALVKKQEIGIAGDEFKSPILLRETSSDNPENQRTPDTTEAPTTTTRRSLLHPPIGDRRHAILPSHRRPYPSNRPGTDTSTRRPFVPPRRPGDRPTRAPPIFTTKTTSRPEDESELTDIDESSFSSARPIIPFEEVPSFIPPRHTTQNTEEITTTAILTTSTTTPLQTTTPTTTSSTTTTTPAPVVSNDIINLLLQDPSRLAEGQSRPPVRFTQQHTTPKPRIPIKVTTALPAIPEAVKNQMPLVTDPVLASGLLKLSGCNIYGRLYAVGGQITELTTGCKECRCTHLGVQCLPVC